MMSLLTFSLLYFVKQIDSMLSCVYSLIDLRRHKNVVRTSVTDLPSSWCATFLFLPHFDVVYDLLKRRMSTWNLFVKLIQYDSGVRCGILLFIRWITILNEWSQG